MTEEMTPEFLQFSEMLDADEPNPGDGSEQAKLMLDLREILREGIEPEPDFAEKTTQKTLEAYKKLSPGVRLWDAFQSLLWTPAFTPKALPYSGALMGAGFLFWFLDKDFLIPLAGVLTLLASLHWLDRGETPGRAVSLTGLFHNVLPILCVLFTGALAGLGLAGLGHLSLSFQGQEAATAALGVAVGLGVTVLFWKAGGPLSRTLREGGSRHLPMLLAYHGGITLWAAAMLSIFQPYYWQATLVGCSLVSALAVFLVRRESQSVSRPPGLAPALRTLTSSLLLGMTPLLLALFGFYQMHLTKEIRMASTHEFVTQEMEQWLQSRREIPAEDNGWMLVRPFLIKGPDALPENKKIGERLDGLQEFHPSHLNQPLAETLEKKGDDFAKARAQFLSELPRIREALARPEFSYLATEGYSFNSLVPNFIRYRSISYGLSVLVEEAVLRGDSEAALDYAILGLKWADKDDDAPLITHMLKLALYIHGAEAIERCLVEGNLTREQLETLSMALKQHRPERSDHSFAFKAETYFSDLVFQQLMDGDYKALNMPGLARVIPRSYWESERNAYWNFMLDGRSGTFDLAFHQEQSNDLSNLPYNWGAKVLGVNSESPRVQFAKVHSRYSALQIQCALEQFQRETGSYPEELAQLVPTYLKEIPVDTMDPRIYMSKGPFQYEKSEAGYKLISESPAYKLCSLARRQIYGHDGDYELESAY